MNLVVLYVRIISIELWHIRSDEQFKKISPVKLATPLVLKNTCTAELIYTTFDIMRLWHNLWTRFSCEQNLAILRNV